MYEWLKVVHVLAVISWMAGLLYLPRLLVYHVDAGLSSGTDVTFKTMERRLLKAIMRPAALVTLLSGMALIHVGEFHLSENWLWLKLLAVVGMLMVHGRLEMHVARFARGARDGSGRYFRVLNEVPTVLMIIIVIMVIVKPFS